MALRLNSSGGGSVTLDIGSTGSAFTQTLPSATTTIVGTDTTQTLTNKTLSTGLVMGASPVTVGTAQATTSGTSKDFTGIPSWVKRITVIFNVVSETPSNSIPMIQVGTSSGVVTTGYLGNSITYGVAASAWNTSNGMTLFGFGDSARSITGTLTLCQISTNVWVATTLAVTGDNVYNSYGAGSITLSATLDRLRLTTQNGTDTFDAGSINIMYE